jgi:hypothetical protein
LNYTLAFALQLRENTNNLSHGGRIVLDIKALNWAKKKLQKQCVALAKVLGSEEIQKAEADELLSHTKKSCQMKS